MKTDQLNLQSENRALDQAAKTSEFLQKQITEVMIERNKLQSEFDTITKQPFFKRELDQNSFNKHNELSNKIDQKDRAVKESKANIIKVDE